MRTPFLTRSTLRAKIQKTIACTALALCMGMAWGIRSTQALSLSTGAQFTARTSNGEVTLDYPVVTKESYNANSPFAARAHFELADQSKISFNNTRDSSEYKGFVSWTFHKDDEETIRITTHPSNFTTVVNGEIRGLGLALFSPVAERFNSQEPIFLKGKDIKLYVQADENASPEEVKFSTNEVFYYFLRTNPFFPYQFDLWSKKYQAQAPFVQDLQLEAPEIPMVQLGHGDYFGITPQGLAADQADQINPGQDAMLISVEYEESGQSLQTEFPLGAAQQVRVYGKDGPVQYTVSLSEAAGMVVKPLAGSQEGFAKVSLYLSRSGDHSSFDFAKSKITRVALKQSHRSYRYVRTQNLPVGVTQISKALPQEGSFSFEQVGYVQILPENPVAHHASLDGPFAAKPSLDDKGIAGTGNIQSQLETSTDSGISGLGMTPTAEGGGCSLSLGAGPSSWQGLHLLLGAGLAGAFLAKRAKRSMTRK